MRIFRARAAAAPESRHRRLTRFLLVLAIAFASRSAPAWAQSDPAVYGRLYTTGTVFSTTLSSASTPTTTSATLSAADASHFSVGQLANVWLDCATLRGLPAGTPHADLCDATTTAVSVQVVIDSLDSVTGAVTWYGNAFDLPAAPLAGARFDSVLYGPGNLAVDASGRTYVVDSWNSRIAVFDADGTPLYTIGHYGSVYTVDNNTTDADGDGLPDDPLYGYPVASTDPHAVCWDALGNANAPGSGDCPNDPTQLLGLFDYPNDVAVASDGTLIVADSGNHRIQILKPDPAGSIVASDGTTRFTASTFGTWALGVGASVGTMSFPGGVAAGAGGRIAVADTDNSRIEVFDPSSGGTLVASDGTTYSAFTFGSQGENDSQFFYPLDVAIDPSGRLIVADSGNNQVKVFSSTGSHLTTLGNLDGGLDPGQFGYPWGVASDGAGNVLVADTFGQRIQVLTQTSSGYTADSSIQLPTILSPVGVASEPTGGFVATEFGTHKIVRLVAAGLTVQDPVTVSTTRTTSGAVVQIAFTVENSGAVALTSVQPQLTGATTVSCSSGGSSDATDLAVGATGSFTLCFAAGDPNTAMDVQVSATGWAGVTMVTSASKSAPEITVLPAGVGIGITAAASSTRVQVNHTVTVAVTLKNTGSTDLTGVQFALGSVPGLSLDAAGSDSLARPNLAVGDSQTLTLTFDATEAQSAQPLSITVSANETNPDTGKPAEAATSVSIEVVTDVDPPVITAQVRGPLGEAPNAYGWIQYGPASVTITATDSGVGLSSIAYRAISLQSGSQGFNGEGSGSIVSTGFFSRGKGSTLVAFWAEDLAGSAAAAGLMPAAGESVTDFCTRVPAQCVSINVDPFAPFLDHWPAQISDDNTTATIPFDANDSQSGVATIQLAAPQPDASLLTASTSSSQGNLVLTGQGAAVSADVTVTDYAGLQSTFQVPFAGPGKPVLRMDSTPPETFTQADPDALGRRCTATAS
ncbi:MAG TPA: NHL repeat-containing protein, partial [Vicinamibacterales bacterium]|nr:NHL repeat-containing protein [Vicinamibacterales bacterium]